MSFRKRRSSATLQLDGASKVQTNRKFSAASFEPLENMVVCPIDLNLLEDPRLLPCGHAFCCECLTKYMHQLPTTGQEKTSTFEEPKFSCPICRTVYPVPPTRNASTFPKAFNHLVILEFLRKNQMQTFKTPSAPPLAAENENISLPMVAIHRKSSTQVSSQMLNYIVNDITARERDGKIGPADRAVIMDEVSKLLQRLEGDHKRATPEITKNLELQHASSVCTTPTNSPNGSVRGLGRFHAFADKVQSRRRSSVRLIQHEAPSYTTYRDVESLRWTMKHKSVYQVLTKGKDCCVMRAGEMFQPVDMQLIPQASSAQVLRCTLTTDVDRRNLVLWSQKIKLDQRAIPADSNRPKSTKESPIQESRGIVQINGLGAITVQYVRFFKQQIYLTGVISKAVSPSDQEENRPETTIPVLNSQSEEYALLVRCEATILNESENATANGTDNSNNNDPFPVRAMSCLFRRDAVGHNRLDQPILFGIDIDQTSGDIYLAQPANAMICRLKSHDLSRIDAMWYLNEPQLSPSFLCYTNDTREIWATCQREDKVVILDLDTNGFHHFKPSVSFGISPSHVVYTSDRRIVMLDCEQSRLVWISKIHHTICVQFLDVQFPSRQRRKFLAIQPVDDAAVMGGITDSKKVQHLLLNGGILCAHDCGCSIIYPKKQLSKLRSVRIDCTAIFSC